MYRKRSITPALLNYLQIQVIIARICSGSTVFNNTSSVLFGAMYISSQNYRVGKGKKGCALLPALEQNSSRPFSALAYQVTLIKCSVQRTFLDMFRSVIMRTRKTHRWQAGTGKAQHNNDNPRRLLRWSSSLSLSLFPLHFT